MQGNFLHNFFPTYFNIKSENICPNDPNKNPVCWWNDDHDKDKQDEDNHKESIHDKDNHKEEGIDNDDHDKDKHKKIV